ncbi:hypothetical protein [Thioalkalivibrio sp. HK1]|uniref:hypothetical protein n=1 Tax=Thioalkalivibrio sp. HK1 TaxID=1469245 RepID=UPI0012DE9CBE|nr:hypothetical protein [Thioalkalivibrio sp. HK1]
MPVKKSPGEGSLGGSARPPLRPKPERARPLRAVSSLGLFDAKKAIVSGRAIIPILF